MLNNYIHTLIGIPWVHLGRGKQGLDCVGLLLEYAKIYGFKYDTSAYPEIPVDDTMLREFQTNLREVDEIYTETILAFRVGRFVAHCGISYYRNGELWLLHTDKSHGKSVTHPIGRWENRICNKFLLKDYY